MIRPYVRPYATRIIIRWQRGALSTAFYKQQLRLLYSYGDSRQSPTTRTRLDEYSPCVKHTRCSTRSNFPTDFRLFYSLTSNATRKSTEPCNFNPSDKMGIKHLPVETTLDRKKSFSTLPIRPHDVWPYRIWSDDIYVLLYISRTRTGLPYHHRRYPGSC